MSRPATSRRPELRAPFRWFGGKSRTGMIASALLGFAAVVGYTTLAACVDEERQRALYRARVAADIESTIADRCVLREVAGVRCIACNDHTASGDRLVALSCDWEGAHR